MPENDNPYRLNDDVAPTAYMIRLAPDLRDFSTTGSVTIDVQVRRGSDAITLNLKDIELIDAVLTDAAGVMSMTSHDMDDLHETCTLRFPRAAVEGPATLDIAFRGEVNDGLHGLYRATYVDPEGSTQVLAATQCQDTHARSVFPCWDEPAFKATFQMELTVAEDLQAYANGAEVERDVADVPCCVRSWSV